MITTWLIIGLIFSGFVTSKHFKEIQKEGHTFGVFFIISTVLLWPFFLLFEINDHFKK